MPHPESLTEQRVAAHDDLDLRPTRELVELINAEDRRVAPAVGAAAPELAAAIDDVVARLEQGGRLVYVGAGSSGRLALVDAAECGPTFGVGEDVVLALVAGGAGALAVAQEAAEDDEEAGTRDLRDAAVVDRDAVVVVSASGETPYALGAARAAQEAGALVVSVTCTDGSSLAAVAEHAVVARVGPEVIAGSTRMKCGTAQKLVLNTISTVAMMKLGRTYGDLMVGVVASNAKLRARARRNVAHATGAPEEAVDAAIAAADGDVRVAIVSLLAGVDAEQARARLDAAGGVIRRAVSA